MGILEFLRNEMDDSFKEKVTKCSWITPKEHKQLCVISKFIYFLIFLFI